MCLSFSAQTSKKPYKKFSDSEFKTGDVILSPDILFDLSRCNVRPDCKDSVKVIADFLKQHPRFQIEIGVHTDNRGSKEMNIKTSECRAKALLLFLNEVFSIPQNTMNAKGYGSTELLVSDVQIKKISDNTKEGKLEKEELHQKNRRVELKIIGT